jgi:excisionase family DNA binding protein
VSAAHIVNIALANTGVKKKNKKNTCKSMGHGLPYPKEVKMAEKKSFYTVKEMADALEVSVSTVHNLIKDEYIDAYQINDRGTWRIRPAEFRRVIKESK